MPIRILLTYIVNKLQYESNILFVLYHIYAFDTLNHDIIVLRLNEIGIHGQVYMYT